MAETVTTQKPNSKIADETPQKRGAPPDVPPVRRLEISVTRLGQTLTATSHKGFAGQIRRAEVEKPGARAAAFQFLRSCLDEAEELSKETPKGPDKRFSL